MVLSYGVSGHLAIAVQSLEMSKQLIQVRTAGVGSGGAGRTVAGNDRLIAGVLLPALTELGLCMLSSAA